MKQCGTTSSGATASMSNPARLRTERRIMPSAIFMKGRGMGSFCSSTSSTISSVSRANGLSITWKPQSITPQHDSSPLSSYAEEKWGILEAPFPLSAIFCKGTCALLT